MTGFKKVISSVTLFFVLLLLLAASSGMAGEECSSMSGKCRNACSQNEEAQIGAFMDCGEKQECCVVKDPSWGRINCCVYSFGTGNYGADNCGLPINNVCSKGSGSPLACETLKMCKDQ